CSVGSVQWAVFSRQYSVGSVSVGSVSVGSGPYLDGAIFILFCWVSFYSTVFSESCSDGQG
ncbi:MAG: hypothetical protein MI974_00995, partial [Chitinophagales bacterium]|nr:hypothetical protein [Chitinophagales bacterium]